jgi:hypothetical protein
MPEDIETVELKIVAHRWAPAFPFAEITHIQTRRSSACLCLYIVSKFHKRVAKASQAEKALRDKEEELYQHTPEDIETVELKCFGHHRATVLAGFANFVQANTHRDPCDEQKLAIKSALILAKINAEKQTTRRPQHCRRKKVLSAEASSLVV